MILDFRQTIKGGTRKEQLTAMRDMLAASIEDAEPDKRAGLARLLVDVLAELDRLYPANDVKSDLDEIKRRRERSRAA